MIGRIRRAIDAWRHPGEYPAQRARRRWMGVLDRQPSPKYLTRDQAVVSAVDGWSWVLVPDADVGDVLDLIVDQSNIEARTADLIDRNRRAGNL